MEHIAVSEIQQGVATLTLQRPAKKNALSIALREECVTALRALARAPELKVLILTGAGDVFCAGFDLTEFERGWKEPAFSEVLWESADAFFRAVACFPLPTLAAIRGAAYGGGFDLATMCDLRICTEDTSLSHPEATFGRVTYAPLHELVGGARAREYALTGRKISAQEAAAVGLVSRVVPRDALDSAAEELALQVARAPRPNLIAAKSKFIERSSITGQRLLDL
jgi:enoyl-CoA hydratase